MIPRPAIADPFGLVGRLLERKYRVDRTVAEGGFGIVYAAHHIGLDTRIALKVLRPNTGADPAQWADGLAQFLQEAKTIARLRHPAIVSVLDVGVMHPEAFPLGVPWMVMEWLEGETLKDDLARRRGQGGRSAAQTLALMRPVLEAIAEGHEAGVVHRDLKPSNVMLVPHKRGVRARVVDFGIAKVMDGREGKASGDTTTGGPLNAFSAASAAPEQISGMRTGPWTDVHALGLLLTEVLTDHPPYPLDDPNDHFRAVFDETRPTPGKLGVDVGGWEPILARALALKPGARYADAAELLLALENALPSGARVAPTAEPTVSAKEPKRSRRAGVLVAGAFALVAGAVIFARVGRGPSPVATVGDAAGPVRCVSHAACTAQNAGRAAICRPSSGCVVLASDDCRVLADARALESDRTVWIGAMFPLTGDDAKAFGDANLNAVDLARRDFAQITAGLTEGSDRARPFGVIGCDDAVDPRRAARHLVDDVGVAAVIGFRGSIEAIDLATSLFVPKRVLTVAALNTNPLVTTVPQPADEPRLVWRTTYNSADTAGALSAVVSDVFEPQLRADGGPLGPKGAMRVALFRQKNAAGAAFAGALFTTLRFNQKSALANGYDFREVTLESGGPDEAREIEAVADDLVRFRPHVVILSGGATVLARAAERVEAGWPRTERYRPRYANAALLTPELLAFIGDSADRRRRFFGVTTVSTIAPNARFVMHYNEVFPDKITRTISPNTAYDAFYLLAYATYALAPDEPATGPALARGFARLVPPGPPVDVGIAGIFDAFAALRAGKNIDLGGATGSLDFDLTTGEAPLDHAVVCAAVDERGRAFDGVESGLVWSAKTRRLDGTMQCR